MDPATIGTLAALFAGQMVQGGLSRAAQQKQAEIGRRITGIGEAADIERAGYEQAQQQSGLAMKDYINTLRAQLG